jgi:hypothetical protein
MIFSTGQFGVKTSSERYKKDVTPMGAAPEQLERLRPVTFHYKSDGTGSLEFGLIAEEVARVYPELVIRNQSGRIEGVRYDELTPMLLNELQQQRKQMNAQAALIRNLNRRQNEFAIQTQQLHDA